MVKRTQDEKKNKWGKTRISRAKIMKGKKPNNHNAEKKTNKYIACQPLPEQILNHFASIALPEGTLTDAILVFMNVFVYLLFYVQRHPVKGNKKCVINLQ